MEHTFLSRRRFLGGAAALLAAGAVQAAAGGVAVVPAGGRRRVLRAAHFTDIHVLPPMDGFGDAEAGFTAALRHAQGQADKPDVLFFGGDLIMDALERPKELANAQWDVWDRVFAAEVKTPHRLCLGNHDIWGWATHDRPEIEEDADYGKALAMRRLGMKERYYSYDQARWHFVVLDSMQRDHGNKEGYTARLDDAQFAWLAKDLAAVPAETPVCVLSHIPILSACGFFFDQVADTGSWSIPGAWCHIDVRRIKDLFRGHPNVKTCLSGHMHLADDVTYLGVRYLCNGAVCGGWWRGDCQEFGPAYALVDFYDDGTVDNRLVFYTQAGGGGAVSPG